ncbi:MAG: tripartite tricarboxylate transporter substrate binding protein [Burkholderiales bacterium]|nr:tripartite tricarboxylate transporter substrate binding protein [Burkholderiales bacterium]
MMSRTFRVLFAVLALLSAPHAGAQRYPAQPVKVIVPFAPGGATDIIARLLAERLAQRLGQPFVVENRGGASGITGTQAVQNAPANGYTLLLTGNGPHATNVALFRKLPYDPLKDFAQVSLTGVLPLVLNVNPMTPAQSFEDFVKWVQANPGKVSYASPGTGSPPHLAMELLAQRLSLSMVHVPYKGSAPAINDLVAGHVPVMFDNVFASIGNVRSGRIRSIAVGAGRRMASLPNVPTFIEAGMQGFEVASWTAMAAPAGTPREIVELLSAEVRHVFLQPEIQTRLVEQGAVPVASTPEQTERFVRDEIQRWSAVVENARMERIAN